MPRFTRLRPGPVGIAVAIYDVWKHLTPRQRKQVLALARKHGPKVAKRVVEFQRARRRA